MRQAAAFAAEVHERAADYVEQAPVLAIAIMAGGGHLQGGRANRAYAAHKFGAVCARGGKLRDVMAAYGLPLVLRKLSAKALSMEDEAILPDLGAVPASALSQAVPDAIVHQRRWLAAVGEWRRRASRCCYGFPSVPTWAVVQTARYRVKRGDVGTVTDFVMRGDVPLNEAWQWPRAVAAAEDWHDRLSAGDAQRRFGVMASQQIDFGAHPDVDVVDGYEFVALRTPMAIHAEGAAMSHCVASYVGSVMEGHCSIVSVRRDEVRLATLELAGGHVRQLKGKCNAAPTAPVREAASVYARRIRSAKRVARAA